MRPNRRLLCALGLRHNELIEIRLEKIFLIILLLYIQIHSIVIANILVMITTDSAQDLVQVTHIHEHNDKVYGILIKYTIKVNHLHKTNLVMP